MLKNNNKLEKLNITAILTAIYTVSHRNKWAYLHLARGPSDKVPYDLKSGLPNKSIKCL